MKVRIRDHFDLETMRAAYRECFEELAAETAGHDRRRDYLMRLFDSPLLP